MDNNYDGHFKQTIVDLSVLLRKLLYHMSHCFRVYVFTRV